MFSPDTSRFANHSRRFQHVLVDEFQDTDPLQIEILWRLCGEAQKDGGGDPCARMLPPGALYLVGDPKQAIYRFQGADVAGSRLALPLIVQCKTAGFPFACFRY